jgi:regulator of protease activity HflC (stomatin/prohibitin superfamily)
VNTAFLFWILMLIGGFIAFIVGIVLIIKAYHTASNARYNYYNNDNFPKKGQQSTEKTKAPSVSLGWVLGGIVTMIFGFFVMFASFGWSQIDPGQVGIKVVNGQVQESLSPGAYWNMPFITNLVKMDTRVQAYNFGKDGNGNLDVEAFTSEGLQAHMVGVINYHIDATYASQIYQTLGLDYVDKVIVHQAKSELKEDSRKYSAEEITSKRSELGQAALERLAKDVEPYHIIIDGIYLSDINLPQAFLDSVTAKQVSAQNVQKAINDAETLRQQAKGQADAQVTLAEGQAKANETIASSLSPTVLQYLALMKLNPNATVIYVPVGQNFLITMPDGTTKTVPADGTSK